MTASTIHSYIDAIRKRKPTLSSATSGGHRLLCQPDQLHPDQPPTDVPDTAELQAY